jgi:hypothetical protein
MKKLLTLFFFLSALTSNAQLTVFGAQNNYMAPIIPFQAPAIITNGLVLNLDAGNPASYSGSGTTWTDLSGNNNLMFYTNSSYNITTNPSYSLDGGGSLIVNTIYGKTVNNSGISGATPRTFEAWVKFNSVGQNVVASIGSSPNNNLFEMMAFQNHIINHIWGSFTAGHSSLATNTWYNIAITYDGATNYNVYLNGILDGGPINPNYNGSLNTINTPVYIGTQGSTTWGPLDGRIGILRLYNRALNATEIATNFNVVKSRFSL